MAKLIYTNNTNRYVYECDECHEKTRTYYSERHGKVVCSDCRRMREREKQKQRQVERIKEAHDKGYERAIDDALSKVRNLVNTECNPSCECQLDCLYLDAISDAVRVLKQLKEQKQIE